MNNKSKVLCIFNIAALSFTVIAIIFFLTVSAVFPRSTGYSPSEKRELATFPKLDSESILNGTYTAGVAEWYTDTVPYRENLLGIAASIKGLYGIDTFFQASNLIDGIQDSRPESDVSDPLADYSEEVDPDASYGEFSYPEDFFE